MNIEQIVSFIDSKEPYDQKALSQIMLMLEKYPYFQTGHMLLLKAMHQTQSENYNNQLKISGGFISDKKKLFQLINSVSVIASVSSSETIEKKTLEKIKEEKTPVKLPVIEKEIEKKTIKEIVQTNNLKEKTQTIEIENNEQDKINQVKNEEISTPETEISEDLKTKNKADLTEEEIIRLSNENSKKRHKEIVKDFFQTKHVQPIEKKDIELEKEPKIEKTEFKNIKTEKTELPDNKIKIIEKREIEKGKLKEEKVIETKEINIEEPIKKIEPEHIEIVEKKIEQEEKPEKEKPIIEENKQIEEPKKDLIIKKTVETSKTDDSSSVMNNIFSKIRQIKKEMNINSENTPETIDIENGNPITRLSKSKIIEEKKGTGRVIKESYIGFAQDDIDKQNNDDEKDEEQDNKEKEVIKEIGITAKDLFKQHIKNKETIEKSENSKTSTNDESIVISPISKVVANLNEEKSIKTEVEKEITFEKKEFNKEKEDIILTEQKISDSKSTNAADALLKRIEERKRKKKEEESDEEIKNSEIKKVEEITPDQIQDIEIQNTIEKDEKEIVVKEEIPKKEIIQNTEPEIQEFKTKKSNKLIDNFIEKAPTLDKIGMKETTINGDISISSADEKEEFMTETMADIQIQQKNYSKAIEIYKKLILKFPEKKTYFAIQIKKVESLIKS